MKILEIIILIFFNELSPVAGNWANQLKDYHIIPRIKLRFSRSDNLNRNVYINTKYRNFKLILKPTKDLFTQDFQSSTVDRFGNKMPIEVDRSQFLQGLVSGSNRSSVRAFLGSEDTISINIAVYNEIYQIESLSIYERSNSSLLVYRYNDLKSNDARAPICPSKGLSLHDLKSTPGLRNKRATTDAKSNDKDESKLKKFCTIRLVADYKFFREHGKGDKTRTNNYLIEMIDSINQLFQATEFIDSKNTKYIGYGFLIQDIIIHYEWTVGTPGHYNSYRPDVSDAWDAHDLLISFGAEDYSDVCVSHLLTYQSFSNGTLGYAWMGSWKSAEQGGICSHSKIRHRGTRSVNTAWSTYKDSVGNHLVSLSAYLVTTHELGHNWGTDHDPSSHECSPNANAGGKYIMYTYSVTGFDKNNRIFSPCSRRSIGETITSRGEKCFKSTDVGKASFCGNRRVENPEQCDIGNNIFNDICCNEKCRFRPEKNCSPLNHDCCTNDCQIKPRGEICAKADPNNPCLGDAVCDGINRTCLPPKPLTGPTCTEQGTCVDGRCRPFCETIHLEACICDQMSETCDICCRNRTSDSKECQLATKFMANNSLEYKLNDGRPCTQGVCDKGLCRRRVNKLIERIWKLIDNLSTNSFTAFLLDNLVGTVIFLSLLLWIPASIAVSCHDARYRELIIAERLNRRQTPQTMF